MAPVVIPFADSEMTLLDRPSSRRSPLRTVFGSKLELRSRRTRSSRMTSAGASSGNSSTESLPFIARRPDRHRRPNVGRRRSAATDSRGYQISELSGIGHCIGYPGGARFVPIAVGFGVGAMIRAQVRSWRRCRCGCPKPASLPPVGAGRPGPRDRLSWIRPAVAREFLRTVARARRADLGRLGSLGLVPECDGQGRPQSSNAFRAGIRWVPGVPSGSEHLAVDGAVCDDGVTPRSRARMPRHSSYARTASARFPWLMCTRMSWT
jgi:hypothetical protein